jgi:hypothetical protein
MNSNNETLVCLILALLPGADEIPPANQAHLFRYVDETEVKEILNIFSDFENFSSLDGKVPISSLEPARIREYWDLFSLENRVAYLKFSSCLLEGYYADPMVLKGAGLRHIPLFPIGMKIEQVDFSMLEKVFDRGPIFKS